MLKSMITKASNRKHVKLFARMDTLLRALVAGCCVILVLTKTSSALTCFCDQCPGDRCTTAEHSESTCYKSVQRVVVNNTYMQEESHGCLSGSDTGLAHLQCRTSTAHHKDVVHISCCNDGDFCNKDLPGPSEEDDPRWNFEEPPQVPTQVVTYSSNIDLKQVLILAFIAALAVGFCGACYKIVTSLFLLYWDNNMKHNNLNSQDSVRSFNVKVDDQLKNHFVNQHHNTSSSSASTHTYTISEYLSQKPGSPHDYEHSIASLEHTTTLPDVTSGIGTKVLVPRTMARVVDCGVTVPVGSGRFGRVFKGQYHGDDVAVKAFQAMDYESWHREESILRKLNHENIVRLIASETYTIESSAVETWMFLEFCPYGSLCDFLDRNEICGPQQAMKIILSIINGLSYLHEDFTSGYKPPIAHRDIKSKNILMRTPEICCIADFGHAVVQVTEEELDFGGYDRFQVGTIRYMAPEILSPSKTFDPSQFYTFAQADLYQFGLVLWEICHRTALDVLHPSGPHSLPYDGKVPQNPGIEDMIQLVCKDNYRPPRPPHWERHGVMRVLSALMVECWRSNPKARMETLGIKKRIKELYERAIPSQPLFYHANILEASQLNPNFVRENDKFKSSEYTL